ncbi:glyoxalase [bacterium]|nr:MAG: glyoxalase [bacterium]
MRIEHIAVWTGDLERLKSFYETWFGAKSGDKYTNPAKGYESYFLNFTSGTRMEIMKREDMVSSTAGAGVPLPGYAHAAFSVGSREKVDELTRRLREAGINVVEGPRSTGDGYYESVVLDPDGNRVEITV